MTPAMILSGKLTPTLGVYIQPEIGNAYPELVAILRDLYTKRVSKLPFVPLDWLAKVLEQMGTEGHEVVIKLQQSLPHGQPYKGLPQWIVGDVQAMHAWQSMAEVIDDAVAAFAAQRVEAGKAIVAHAQANAQFWDSLYTSAKFVRDLPGNVVGAVGDGALSVVKAFLARTWYLVALAVVGLLVWLNRESIFKAMK